MKIIFMEYLASLKEREELDAILPDLLIERGYSVISKPAIGTKQFGVDVAAIGTDGDGVRKVFLFSIKPGDLRRRDWDTGEQSLRPSLNQILDVYIPHHIPERYRDLPIVVSLCIGGILHEDVKADVNGFMETNGGENTEFTLWDGDFLADALLSGLLRERFLPKSWRSDFRKCVALVDEPQVSFEHFNRFVVNVLEQCQDARRSQLRAIRQIYIALWTLYVWGREAENIESAYLASEYALLQAWFLARKFTTDASKDARHISDSIERLITLHQSIADDYLKTYVEPRAFVPHGLTSAVPSQFALDINLRLFDILGRVATQGLWLLHETRHRNHDRTDSPSTKFNFSVEQIGELLISLIYTNPILYTPIKDSQATDINIACLFLNQIGRQDVIAKFIRQTSYAVVFAYRRNGPYPCVFDDYQDLLDHPRLDNGYRTKATEASILYPTLAVWAATVNDEETLRNLSDFVSKDLDHCALQLLYPGPDSEEAVYTGGNHGLCSAEINIPSKPEQMLSPILEECNDSRAFYSLSAYSQRRCPLLVTASRHFRMPLPPHLWQEEWSQK